MIKKSFPPIIDKNCKVIILGSMPGEVSLRTNQYYNNPQNQFWKIISYITNENFNFNYEEKKRLLLKHHIAVWDVLMHCEREGSLDIAIKEEFPNDFTSFYKKYPTINSIFFNGNKPYSFYKKLVGINSNNKYSVLPGTSSANTSMTLEIKKEIWKEKISKALSK